MASKNKELKKLSRRELLELLIEQGREIDELREKLDIAEEKLSDRSIKLRKAGTVAEAAFLLNGVYEATEAAASQYLENIKSLSASYEEECNKMVTEAEEKAKKIIEDAEAQKMLTIKAADDYWLKMKEKTNENSAGSSAGNLSAVRPEDI